MKKSNGMQLGAMLAAMLILMATIAVPVAVADENAKPISNEKKNGSCTGCANNNGSCGGAIVGNKTELLGTEKDKVLDMAFSNKEVQKLQSQLKTDGFRHESDNVFSVPVKTKDGSIVDVQVATIRFKSSKGEVKQINFLHNPKTGESVVVLGILACAECLGAIIFGGATCAAVCVVGGVITMGALCIGCILLADAIALCPCYDCCYSLTGNQACYNTYQKLCTI